jgi:2'-5' RNA ligase
MTGGASSSAHLRTFIAVDPSPAVQAAVDAEAARLRAWLGRAGLAHTLRWSPATNLHCTLRFLGNTTPAQGAQVRAALQALSPEVAPFRLTVAGVGAFPHLGNPRVLWFGLGGDVAALAALQARVEALTVQAGWAGETKPFAAHLTVARAVRSADRRTLQPVGDLLAQAAATSPASLGSFAVERLIFYQSELQPGGSRYTPLAVVPLAGAN